MKIINSHLAFYKETAIISFLIEDLDFQKIKTKSLFNFEENLFESALPGECKEGKISLIADKIKTAGYVGNQEFELAPEDWHILRLELDNLEYETFLSLRLDGKLPGTIEEAVTNFALIRSKGTQEISKETEHTIKETFAEVLNLGLTRSVNPFNLNSIFLKLISKITGTEETISVENTIPTCLKEMDIPFVKEENSYLFSVSVDEDNWDIEIRPSETKETLLVFSYLRLDANPSIEKELQPVIDLINEEMKYGEVEFDVEQKLLVLTSEIKTISLTSTTQLKLVLEPIFESMNIAILVLKSNFEEQIIFSKMEFNP
jgi:hypothetical protein